MLGDSKPQEFSACQYVPNRNSALSHPELASRWRRQAEKWDLLSFPACWDCLWCMHHSPHTPVNFFSLGQQFITLNPPSSNPFVIIIF